MGSEMCIRDRYRKGFRGRSTCAFGVVGERMEGLKRVVFEACCGRHGRV